LVLAATGAAPVVVGFAGVAAGAGVVDGCMPCAKTGADNKTSATEVRRMRRVVMDLVPL
jgi:hypothetical protein